MMALVRMTGICRDNRENNNVIFWEYYVETNEQNVLEHLQNVTSLLLCSFGTNLKI